MEVHEPRRATRRRAFRVSGDADAVFPLFCPVRELDWLESWSPGAVYSNTGVVEPECVFTSSDANGDATWLVVEHDAPERHVKLVKLTPGFTACLLDISVRAAGAESEVSVSYSHTALSERGAAFVESFTEDAYTRIMEHWQSALAYFLKHGAAKPGS